MSPILKTNAHEFLGGWRAGERSLDRCDVILLPNDTATVNIVDFPLFYPKYMELKILRVLRNVRIKEW